MIEPPIAVRPYNAEFAPPKNFSAESQTLALYDFADGTGDLLTDASGHRLHGPIAGAKWIAVDSSTTDRDREVAQLVWSLANGHVQVELVD